MWPQSNSAEGPLKSGVIMTKDEQIKDLQAELERTAKYAERVTRERDKMKERLDLALRLAATVPHLGEIK